MKMDASTSKKRRRQLKKKYKTGLYVHYDPGAFEEEKHFSPKRQLRTLHTTLDRHPELIKVKEYIDLDDSAGDQKVFYEMLQDIYEGKIECLIVRSVSVIGSYFYIAVDFVKKFSTYMELRVIAVRDNFDSKMDHLWNKKKLEQIMHELNERHVKETVFNSRNRHWEEGQYHLGPVPYGYFRVAGHLYIDPDAAHVVRNIFERYVKGDTPYMIADDLKEMNVMSPREYFYYMKYGELSYRYEWKNCTIFRMIQNQFYAGDTVHRRYRKLITDKRPDDTLPKEDWLIVENTHEAIVPKDLFDKAQKRLKDISEKKIPWREHICMYYGPPRNYLREKIFCGKCGSTCKFRYQTTWAGFRCADKDHVNQNGCDGLSIPLGTVNMAILDALWLKYGIKYERVDKMLVDRNVSKVVIHEGGIVYVELRRKRGET